MIFLGHLGITTAAMKKCEHLFSDDNNKIDYRVVFLGSVLPDIIDKPIAFFILDSSKVSDRLFGHTLIFSIILIILGYIYSTVNCNKNILILGVCSLIHLILDSMWLFPRTLFYPLYGINFPFRLKMSQLPIYFTKLYSRPFLFISEIIGGAILIYYFIALRKHTRIYEFIKKGKL